MEDVATETKGRRKTKEKREREKKKRERCFEYGSSSAEKDRGIVWTAIRSSARQKCIFSVCQISPSHKTNKQTNNNNKKTKVTDKSDRRRTKG